MTTPSQDNMERARFILRTARTQCNTNDPCNCTCDCEIICDTEATAIAVAIDAAVAEERKACAGIAAEFDRHNNPLPGGPFFKFSSAEEAIRARGEVK